jgi:hypothetical protein
MEHISTEPSGANHFRRNKINVLLEFNLGGKGMGTNQQPNRD